MSENTPEEHLTLKWGTLKSWHFNSDEALRLLEEYFSIGCSLSAMLQKNSKRQREIILELIDLGDFDTVHLGWEHEDVSKERAKNYVLNYGVKA